MKMTVLSNVDKKGAKVKTNYIWGRGGGVKSSFDGGEMVREDTHNKSVFFVAISGGRVKP